MTSIKSFIAALVGGLFGFGQIFGIALLEEMSGRGDVPLKLAWTAMLWICLKCLEMMAVIALAMFRISPFIARLLGDAREAQRIEASKRQRYYIIQTTSALIVVASRIVFSINVGDLSIEAALALGVGLLSFAFPRNANLVNHHEKSD